LKGEVTHLDLPISQASNNLKMQSFLICVLLLVVASTMVLAQGNDTSVPPAGGASEFAPVTLLALLPAFLYSLFC
jgi:hypothetical protein